MNPTSKEPQGAIPNLIIARLRMAVAATTSVVVGGGGRRAKDLAALVERRGHVGADGGRREQQARRSLHFVRKG